MISLKRMKSLIQYIIVYSKSYIRYLNKLTDEYNNTYHHSVGKRTNDVDCSALTEETMTNPIAPVTILKMAIESGL